MVSHNWDQLFSRQEKGQEPRGAESFGYSSVTAGGIGQGTPDAAPTLAMDPGATRGAVVGVPYSLWTAVEDGARPCAPFGLNEP